MVTTKRNVSLHICDRQRRNTPSTRGLQQLIPRQCRRFHRHSSPRHPSRLKQYRTHFLLNYFMIYIYLHILFFINNYIKIYSALNLSNWKLKWKSWRHYAGFEPVTFVSKNKVQRTTNFTTAFILKILFCSNTDFDMFDFDLRFNACTFIPRRSECAHRPFIWSFFLRNQNQKHICVSVTGNCPTLVKGRQIVIHLNDNQCR